MVMVAKFSPERKLVAAMGCEEERKDLPGETLAVGGIFSNWRKLTVAEF